MPALRKRRYPSFRRKTSFGRRRRKFYNRIGYRRSAYRYMKRRRIANIQPNAMFAKLHYYDHWDLTSGINTYVSQTFRLNSIYDPDYTGVGGQPSGYTEYAGLYNKYRVLGAKVRVRFEANPTMPAMIVGFRTRWNEAAVATGLGVQQTLTELKNQTRCRWLPATTSTPNSSEMVQWCKAYIPMKKMFSTGHRDEDFEALFGNNPVSQCYLDVLGCGVNATETPLSVKADVMITYYCKFLDKAVQYAD